MPWSHCPVCGTALPQDARECPSCHAGMTAAPRSVPDTAPQAELREAPEFVDFHAVAHGVNAPPLGSGLERLRNAVAWRPAPAQALGALADALLSATVASSLGTLAAALSAASHDALARHLLAIWIDVFLLVDVLGRGGALALGFRTIGMRIARRRPAETLAARAIQTFLPSPLQAVLACLMVLPGSIPEETTAGSA